MTWSSSRFPSHTSLSQQLQKKEEEIQRLRLLQTQHAEAEGPLYTELEKLSAAWETLDRQVKDKIFDLAAMEEKVGKIAIEV